MVCFRVLDAASADDAASGDNLVPCYRGQRPCVARKNAQFVASSDATDASQLRDKVAKVVHKQTSKSEPGCSRDKFTICHAS